ncbi:MAG: hypothetical protein LBQ88_01385 [Treponema sp.]|nr:hypothetical protein [Treponema sp.]
MREGIYQRGGWFASFSGHKLINTLNGYSVLDFLPRLTDFEPEKENTVLLMVNNTTHNPSFMQAPDYRPVLNVTNYGTSPYSKESEYHGNAASLLRLADWFDCFAKGTYPLHAFACEPWGGTKGMYPESNTLPEQHTPLLAAGLLIF